MEARAHGRALIMGARAVPYQGDFWPREYSRAAVDLTHQSCDVAF